MKKIIKNSLFLAALLSAGIMTTNAKVMTAADIDKALTFDTASNDADPAYIFGKHVYVNEYTMADATAAANTLAGQTDAVLIYKNGKNVWVNAVTKEPIDKDSFSMEMVKLIGEPANGNFVSYDSSLNAERLEQLSRSGDSRVEDVFVDENSPIQIIGISKVTPNSLGGTVDADDIHKYNTASMDIKYSGNVLTLTENSPLLAYYNELADKATGIRTNEKWVGLLFRTNKMLPEKFTLTVGDKKYTQSDIKNLNGNSQGAQNNQYLIWIEEDTFTKTPSIKLSYQDKDEKAASVKQTITVSEKYIKTFVEIPEKDAEVEVLTNGVASTTVKVNETTKTLVYSKDEKVTKIDYTVNGDKKRYDGKKIIDLIDVKENSFRPASKDMKASSNQSDITFNQKAISVSSPVESTDKDADYIVTITANKNLVEYQNSSSFTGNRAWLALLADLGINPANVTIKSETATTTFDAVSGAGVTNAGGRDKIDGVAWLQFKGTDNIYTKILTFENSTNSDKDDSVKIKFVLKEEIPAFDLNSVKVANVSEGTNIDSKINASSNTGIVGAIREVVKANSDKIGSKIAIKEIMDTTGKVRDKYTVKLNADDELAKLGDVLSDNTITGSVTYTKGSKVIALVVDFGVDPENITATISSGKFFLIGTGKPVVNTPAVDLSSFGANGTEFVIVIVDETTDSEGMLGNFSITFKNEDTNVTTKVDFTTVEQLAKKDNSITDGTSVTIDSKYADVVSYSTDKKSFVINEDVTTFKANVNGVERTYQYTSSGWKYSESIEIKDAEVAKYVDSLINSKHNQESAKVTNFGKDYIDIEISRDLEPSKNISLILDFGKKVVFNSDDGDKIKAADVSLLSETQKTKSDNYAQLIIDPALADKEGKLVVKVRRDNSSVEQEITINITKAENPTDIKPIGGHAIELGSGNTTLNNIKDVENGGAKELIKYNAEAVQKVEVTEDGIVRIYINKKLNGLKEWSNTNVANGTTAVSRGKTIAIILDLNTSVKENGLYTGKNVNTDFGASSTETLFFIDASKFTAKCSDNSEHCYANPAEYTFTNADENNTYNTANIKFEIVEDVEELDLDEISMVTTKPESVKDVMSEAGFESNQSNYGVTFVKSASSNTLTINPLSDKSTSLFSYTVENAGTAKWIGVEVDFGTKVAIDSANSSNIKIEELSGTSMILWINTTKFASSTKVTFTSTYDDANSFSLYIQNENTVKAN